MGWQQMVWEGWSVVRGVATAGQRGEAWWQGWLGLSSQAYKLMWKGSYRFSCFKKIVTKKDDRWWNWSDRRTGCNDNASWHFFIQSLDFFFQSGSLSFLSPTACCWGWEAPIGLPPATTIFVFGNFSDQNLTFLFLLSKFEIIISHFSFYSRNSRSEFQISLSTNLLFWLSSMPYYGLPIYLQKSFISIQDTGHMRGGHTAWAPKGCGLKKVPEVGVQRAPKLLYDIWSWEYVTICVRQLQFLSRENLIFYCSKSQLCLSGDIINRTMWVGGGGEGEGGVVGHVQPVNSCQMGSLRLLGGNNIPSRTSRG